MWVVIPQVLFHYRQVHGAVETPRGKPVLGGKFLKFLNTCDMVTVELLAPGYYLSG